MLESIIRDKIMSCFTSNNFFVVSNMGLETKVHVKQLLSVIEHWARIIDSGDDINVIN